MKEIELSKNGWKNRGKYKAYVDDDLFDIVNQYDWSYHNKGYAYNSKMKIQLHRYIYELKFGKIPEGLEVDHIDQDGLNCQISNLRLATYSENNCNKKNQKNNTSGSKGIYKEVRKYEKEDGSTSIYECWCVRIRKDKKAYAKYFPYTDEGFKQAQNWYKQMSLKLHGEFSIYNRDKK